MAKRQESFFWTSYSDLMTSLFFIMLVLFVLVIVLLYKRMEVTERQLDAIRKVEASTKDLKSKYFDYRPQYKKYVLNISVKFPKGSGQLDKISEEKRDSLYEAGREIKQFLDKHGDYQYLLIIEGQASNDNYSRNYELSYERALGLIRYWTKERGLVFGDNCEIQIAGSGDGKIDTHSMRERNEESNQRFLIHILPKNIIKDEDKK
ncbi:MAG: hypothetical protein IKH32_00495 [Prevotella sp.]|nr:hypothetical protein [Prevotella sp.]